jgi:hypothetical protein
MDRPTKALAYPPKRGKLQQLKFCSKTHSGRKNEVNIELII